MDSLVQAKIRRYLKERLGVSHFECGSVVAKVCELARASGHALDDKFGYAGLGSGPEGRLASAIVARALGNTGSATAEHELRQAVARWIRQKPPMGA